MQQNTLRKVVTPKGRTIMVDAAATPEQEFQLAMAEDAQAPAGPQEAAKASPTKPVTDAYAKFISNPLDRASDWIKNLPNSQNTGALSNNRILANLMTSPLQLVAHPKDNADVIGGIAGDALAAYASGGTSLPATIARRIGGGVLGQVLGGLVKRNGDTTEVGWDVVAGGAAPLVLGAGSALVGAGAQKMGRSMARRALDPTEEELFQLFQAKTGSPRGFNVGRGERILAEDAFTRGPGAIGGQTWAGTNQARVDASELAKQGIISQTRREFTQPFQVGDSSTQNFIRRETSMPKPEFSINLNDATRGVAGLRNEIAGSGGGMTTRATGEEVDAARASFLDRPADSRPFDLRPNQLLLEEGQLKVPLPPATPDATEAMSRYGLGYENRGALRDMPPTHPFGIPRDVPGSAAPPPAWSMDSSQASIRGVNEPSLGAAQTALAPNSALKGPTTFTGEIPAAVSNPARPAQATVPVDADVLAALGGTPVTAPQGVMMMPVEQARQLRAQLLEAMQDPKRVGNVARAQELVEALNKVLPEEAGVPTRQVGFDTAVDIKRALDKDLMRDYQAMARAGGKKVDYVPSPTGETTMNIRSALSDLISQKAPMGELGGAPISWSDLMDRYSQDVVWNQLAQRATGTPSGGLHAAAGMNRTGHPYARTSGGFSQFSGPLAKPVHGFGTGLLNNATNSMTLYRALQALSRPKENQ